MAAEEHAFRQLPCVRKVGDGAGQFVQELVGHELLVLRILFEHGGALRRAGRGGGACADAGELGRGLHQVRDHGLEGARTQHLLQGFVPLGQAGQSVGRPVVDDDVLERQQLTQQLQATDLDELVPLGRDQGVVTRGLGHDRQELHARAVTVLDTQQFHQVVDPDHPHGCHTVVGGAGHGQDNLCGRYAQVHLGRSCLWSLRGRRSLGSFARPRR
mmetsp:Transcript_15542/g.27562  ORF Transcript_15542/g.27562 Transcript_15542/m.27562 type:complete len:215 (+) Transcript_15542:1068-1712(+)